MVDCGYRMAVCGVVIVESNDMFEDVEEFSLLFINIKDFSALIASLGEELLFVDVDGGVDEDNGRFAVAFTVDANVTFDVAGDDECKIYVKIREKSRGENFLNYSCNKFFSCTLHSGKVEECDKVSHACGGWMFEWMDV